MADVPTDTISTFVFNNVQVVRPVPGGLGLLRRELLSKVKSLASATPLDVMARRPPAILLARLDLLSVLQK